MLRKLLHCLLALMLLPFCASAATLAVATDLHYIAPELTDHGSYFTRMLAAGDGKVTMYCEELTDAFIDEVLAARPDALLLTGDLTFNGAMQSHRALAEKLTAVQAAGIPVLVIPGNHDVYNSNAASFSGDSYTRVASATEEDFLTVWHSFGYDDAVARDDASLSYVYALPDGTRILMLDFNTAEAPCGCSRETLQWIEAQLREGVDIAAGHQNLLQHSLFRDGYVIDGADPLLALLQQYDVRLFLSGHMHIQHILQSGCVTEIAGSSLCVAPCQYGIVTTAPLTYETRQVQLTVTDDGGEEVSLARFAADYMDAKTVTQLAGMDEAMVDFACEANRCYFSGRMDLFPEEPALLAAWEQTGSFFGVYLASMQADAGKNFTVWRADDP